MIYEYVFGGSICVHESIYPKLIELWNRSPRHYRNYLTGWGFTHGQCEKILDKIEEWIKVNREVEFYINEY